MDKNLILFLSASSDQADTTPFIEAYKDIKNTITESSYRDYFELDQGHRVSLQDLCQYLESERPQIVHFFGHGEKKFLLLEDDTGQIQDANLGTFASAFKFLNERAPEKERIQCVVLVACNSKKIAEEVAKYVNFAIGMPCEILADVGRIFAKNFYRYLADGNSIKWSYDYACTATGFDERDSKKPFLATKDGVDPSKTYLVPPSKYAKFSGSWEGIHLTKDLGGATIFSRHHYNLEVTPSGKVTGSCKEMAAKPPYTYELNGEIRYDSIFWIGEIQDTPTYTWLFNLYDLNAISGFILSRDFNRGDFSTYILLSKRPIKEKDYLINLKKAENKFYLSPPK